MALYSAAILDVAKPVKKGKKVEVVVPKVVPTEKKPRTEKQIAALAKAAATRKAKREAKVLSDAVDKAVEEEKVVVEEKVEPKVEPKAKVVRVVKPKVKKQEVTPEGTVDEEEEVMVVKKEKRKRSDKPPAWFRQYVDGVKNVESEMSTVKKPKRTLVRESREAAEASWGDGLTRNMVQNEVDGHLSRLHGMIFSGRRMK